MTYDFWKQSKHMCAVIVVVVIVIIVINHGLRKKEIVTVNLTSPLALFLYRFVDFVYIMSVVYFGKHFII